MIAKLKSNRVLLVVVSIVACLILLVSFGSLPSRAAAPPPTQIPQVAPLNPDFLDFIQNRPAQFYGYVPPPVDLRHLRDIPVERPKTMAPLGYPATFDWRITGKVTPVKDQNPCGTCWIFGTLAAVESKVLIGESAAFDFSEQNVACCTDPSWVYLDNNRCDGGGSSLRATDTLSKKGTRLEACDPYNTENINTDTCNDTCTSIKYVTGYRLVSLTTADIKDAVSTEGPVSMAFYFDYPSSHYNSTTNVYYYPSCTTSPNHLVCIVGWDDTIAHPEGGGSGAWIVKNSWGTAWGGTCGYGSEKGYFYLAYGSGNMQEAAYYEYKNYDSSEKIYYWDEAGWVGMLGYGDNYAWMANVFNITASGMLTHVDFWTTSNNAAYEIYVYQDNNPADGLSSLLRSQTGSCQEAGYYSIALNSPVSVSAGQQYTIAVKMTTPGYDLPIPIELKVTNWCEPSIQTGVSYIRHSDTGTWVDAGAPSRRYNACLRARVLEATVSVTVTPATIAYGTVALGASKNTTLGQQLTVTNNGTVTADFRIKSSNATRDGGTTWALGATAGNNTFTHAFSTNGGGSWSLMGLADNYYPLASGIAPNATQVFDLQITMPSSTTDYLEHTIIITILAVAAGG